MSSTVQHSVREVAAAIRINGGKVLDEHNKCEPANLKIVARLQRLDRDGNPDGRSFVVAMYENCSCYSINTVELDDETGLPHLTRRSVSVIQNGLPSIEEIVKNFNDQHNNPKSVQALRSHIDQVTRI